MKDEYKIFVEQIISKEKLLNVLEKISQNKELANLLRTGDCGTFAYALANYLKTVIGILVCDNDIENLKNIERIENTEEQIKQLISLEADFAHVFVVEDYGGKSLFFDIDGILTKNALKEYAQVYKKPGIIFFFDYSDKGLDKMIRSETNWNNSIEFYNNLLKNISNSSKE